MALGALLAAIEIGAPVDDVLDGLAGFEGVRRRLELVGTSEISKADGRASNSQVRVFDDYAHHPTEVSATLRRPHRRRAKRRWPSAGGVSAPFIFADKAFAVEFGQALDAADQVFVLDVYGAREQPLAGVSGASVARQCERAGRYLPDFSAVAEEVAAAAGPGDVIVTMVRAT